MGGISGAAGRVSSNYKAPPVVGPGGAAAPYWQHCRSCYWVVL